MKFRKLASKADIQVRLVIYKVVEKLKEEKGGVDLPGLIMTAILMVAIYGLMPGVKTFVDGLWTTITTFFNTIIGNAFKAT